MARKLGISRKLLHDWIKAWKAHGPEGLNRKPGPKPGPRKLKPLQAADEKRSAIGITVTVHKILIRSLSALDCTPGMRHDNFCDRLISRMTCGSKSEKPSVSDVVQIEGDQAR